MTRSQAIELFDQLEKRASEWRDIIADARPDDMDIMIAFGELAALAAVGHYLMHSEAEQTSTGENIPF